MKKYITHLFFCVFLFIYQLLVKFYYIYNRILPKKLLKFCDHIDTFKHIYKYNFLGLCFLLCLFYNRIFVEKLPKNLDLFYMFLIITSIIMIVSQGYLIYTLSKSLVFNTISKKKKKGVFYNIKRKLVLGYKKAKKKFIHKEDLIEIQKFLYKWNLPKRVINTYGILLSVLIQVPAFLSFFYIINYFLIPKIKKYSLQIYILGFICPKIILCLIFFIEVIFFHQINIFYKSLWILLIPIISKILLYTIKIVSVLRLKFLTELITFEVIEEKNIKQYPKDQLCYSEDEETIFFVNWSNPEYKKASKTPLLQIMIEVLNNRQIAFFAEDLYDIDNSLYIQLFKIFIALLTIGLWLYIFFQMIILL